jgi:hypothetical protein
MVVLGSGDVIRHHNAFAAQMLAPLQTCALGAGDPRWIRLTAVRVSETPISLWWCSVNSWTGP